MRRPRQEGQNPPRVATAPTRKVSEAVLEQAGCDDLPTEDDEVCESERIENLML